MTPVFTVLEKYWYVTVLILTTYVFIILIIELKDLKYLQSRNIENLMLLRGDPPKGQKKFEKNFDGFNHASDLIAYAKQING